MHQEQTIRQEIAYLQSMHDRMIRKAETLQHKFLYAHDADAGQEAKGFYEVAREFYFKISSLTWVLDELPPHRSISEQVRPTSDIVP